MLFSIAPKTAANEFFNREKELKNLETAVDKDRIVVLDGLRRIGKTSLLKVFLHETDHFGIFVDCRKFVREMTINTDEFDASIVKAIKEKVNYPQLKQRASCF